LRTKNQIIRKLAAYLEPDSTDFAILFNNLDYLKQWQLDTNQVQALIMPNTYEFYWNTSAHNAIEKIAKSYKSFWNSERKAKAEKLNLQPSQISILASIVEEETNKQDEKPIIAGVYLNRLRINMPLCADPTVKFAVGDFGLKRILQIHTSTQSPYNTYVNTGLPPGPICTPSVESLDAVLNAQEHTYLFFCAKEDFSGYHNFATTYAQHLLNAKRYQQALNDRNIK
jgi:Predicted periplasmic solute-binding protein